MEKTIPLLVESKNGHDTFDIPNEPKEIQNAVEKELKDNKWVTTEQKDGSTEILTEKDIPATDEDKEWANKFENVKSATSTEKANGG